VSTVNGLHFAVTDNIQSFGINTELLHKVVSDRISHPYAQRLVVGLKAPFVSVTLDNNIIEWIFIEAGTSVFNRSHFGWTNNRRIMVKVHNLKTPIAARRRRLNTITFMALVAPRAVGIQQTLATPCATIILAVKTAV